MVRSGVGILILIIVGLLAIRGSAYGQENTNQTPAPAGTVKGLDPSTDEAFLEKYRVATDTKSLIEYFRRRAYGVPDPKDVAMWVSQLGDVDFTIREEAYAKLLQFGPHALKDLKEAATSADVETKKRAINLLQQVSDENSPLVQAAVARLIGLRKAREATPVLVTYLHGATDGAVFNDVVETLSQIAIDNGQADAKLVAALTDESINRRLGAGLAIIRAGAAGHLPAVRKLLQDNEARIQFDIADALIHFVHDKQAVESLIDQSGSLPTVKLWQVDATLRKLAGNTAPKIVIGTDEASRKQFQKAWRDWWNQNKATVNFANLKKRTPNLDRLIVVYESTGQPGPVSSSSARQILEMEKVSKKALWSFNIQHTSPVGAHVFGKNKLALVEYTGNRLSLRDFEGRIEETFYMNGHPISSQLLPSGNFFVVTRNGMQEITAKGKKVFDFPRPANDILRACLIRPDTLAFINSGGVLSYVNIDSKQTVATIGVGSLGTFYGGLDANAAGNVLVPLKSDNEVVEYSADGATVRRYPVESPTSATYLPNGNLLVGSQTTKRVVEINRQGKVFWSHEFPGGILQVQYR